MKNLISMFILVGFITSCSNELSNQPTTNRGNEASILIQLRSLNDSLCKSHPMTRPTDNKKMNYVAQVDAAARDLAICEFREHAVNRYRQLNYNTYEILEIINSYEFKKEMDTYANAVAASASKKAGQRTGDCALIEIGSTTSSATYQDAYRFYKKIELDTTLVQSDVSLLEDIELPDAYSHVISAGYDHNGIIRNSLIEVSLIDNLNSMNILSHEEEPISDEPELTYTYVDSLFNNPTIHSEFNSLYLQIENSMNSYAIDYSSLLESITGPNDLATQIAELYLDAILYCTNNNDMINLANSYISIVNASNLLESYEKEALYSCFVVGVASYALWSELMEEQDIDED